jgi:hypothetical protein
MRFQIVLASVLLLPLLMCACDRAPAEWHLVQDQRSGNTIVSLLSETGELRENSNDLVLEFRDVETGELKPVENVRVQATMPMPGMAPMVGDVSSPAVTAAGRYQFTAEFSMIGGWNLIVTFDPGGRAQFNVSAY